MLLYSGTNEVVSVAIEEQKRGVDALYIMLSFTMLCDIKVYAPLMHAIWGFQVMLHATRGVQETPCRESRRVKRDESSGVSRKDTLKERKAKTLPDMVRARVATREDGGRVAALALLLSDEIVKATLPYARGEKVITAAEGVVALASHSALIPSAASRGN